MDHVGLFQEAAPLLPFRINGRVPHAVGGTEQLGLLQHAANTLGELNEGSRGGNDDGADKDLSELRPALRAVHGRLIVVHHDPDGVDRHHQPGSRDADRGGMLLQDDHDLVESIERSHMFKYPFRWFPRSTRRAQNSLDEQRCRSDCGANQRADSRDRGSCGSGETREEPWDFRCESEHGNSKQEPCCAGLLRCDEEFHAEGEGRKLHKLGEGGDDIRATPEGEPGRGVWEKRHEKGRAGEHEQDIEEDHALHGLEGDPHKAARKDDRQHCGEIQGLPCVEWLTTVDLPNEILHLEMEDPAQFVVQYDQVLPHDETEMD